MAKATYLDNVKDSLENATTPEVENTNTVINTEVSTEDLTTDTVEDTTIVVEDKSTPVTTTTSTETTTTPSVSVTSKTTLPSNISYASEEVSSTEVTLAPISRIETKVTSKSSTPFTIANTQTSAKTITIASIEQMVAQFKVYRDNYLNKNTSNVTPFKDTTEAKTCANAFLAMVNYVITCNNGAVYEEVYRFFNTNKTGILQEMYALQGTNYLKKEECMRVSIFYQVFFSLVSGKKRAINLELTRNIFGSAGDAIVNFIVIKGQN